MANELTFQTLLIAIVLFSGIFVGMTTFISDMQTMYPAGSELVSENSSFNATLTGVTTIGDDMSNLQESVNSSPTTFSDTLGDMFTGLPKFLNLLSQSISRASTMLSEIGDYLGIGQWFNLTIGVILFIIIATLTLKVVSNRSI